MFDIVQKNEFSPFNKNVTASNSIAVYVATILPGLDLFILADLFIFLIISILSYKI